MDPAQDTTGIEHEVRAPILEAVGLTKVFHMGDDTMVTPVTDISLQVGYGDFAVIFGPSGAGKSTLMNILLGLEKPDLGEVFLKGSSLYSFNEEKRTLIRRKRISYLTQAQYWIDYMNIVDNVSLPLILEGVPIRKARRQAEELLGEVGLGAVMKHKPDELSTGQQQKAALARAIIKRPWIIFADEPTAHLDTKSVDEVTTLLLAKAKEYGITIIMVTHDLSFLKLSKKWLFMQDGRIWDIKDRRSPFTSIKDAIDFVGTDDGSRVSYSIDAVERARTENPS